MDESKLAIAINRTAERIRISHQKLIDCDYDPDQILALIVEQSDEQRRIISDMAETAAICQRQFERIKELRLKKTTIRIASNGATD